MTRSIFYKEWIKTRLVWALLLAVNLGYAIYAILRLRYVYVHHDPLLIWNSWIFKGYTFYAYYEKLPLLTGILLAVAQFLPELLNRRMRLSLHLPMGEDRVVAAHLGVGLLLMALLFIPALLPMYAVAVAYFPPEFIGGMLTTSTPWILAGIAAYMFTAALLLEGRWFARIVLAIIAAASLRLFFQEILYSAYERILPVLIAWTALTFFIPLLSSQRFRKGI
ncbi:MAG: hypothetical protein JW942_06685 [Opitutales bacterium]|nr:hypothetical protein [Opitutales bacterium]